MNHLGFITRNDGSASVEFAFVGPLLIGLMLAVVQCGFMLRTKLSLEHAVESAARCAAISSSICGTASAIQTYAATQAYSLNLPASTFAYSKTSCGNQVSAAYTYYFFTSAFSAASMPLTAQACFPS
jgi:Flp pilus assembly protein TadG